TLKPNFFITAVSTNKEWEIEIIMDKVVISLTVSCIALIAPTAEYVSSMFPITKTIAASPGKLKTRIRGLNKAVIHPITGVWFNTVTNMYTGTMVLLNNHIVSKPFLMPVFTESSHIRFHPLQYYI